MAGDWIKIRKNLPADPRVVRISSALQADRLRTVGALISAWSLFDDHTEDGTLDGYTPELFDELVGVPGIARAMAAVGWLEIGDGFLAAPRFDEHNGQSAKKRAQDTVRKASAREAEACPLPKRTKSGPEKRREEGNTGERENAGEEPFAVPPEPEAPPLPDFAETARQIVGRYPRQERIENALKIVYAHLIDGEDPNRILAGVSAGALVIRSAEPAQKRFVPSAESYFRDKRWADDPSTLLREHRKPDTAAPRHKTTLGDDTSLEGLT